MPPGLKPTQGAAGILQGLTALTLIREAHYVREGEWTLVHAAAGGVGLWLCQLLHAVGARVIGTASTAAKVNLAKENGAEFMIDYSHESVVDRVDEITRGVGVSVVFDGVGASTFEDDLKLLARKGTLCSFGNASGAVPPFAIARLSAKNLKVCRPTLFNYVYTREEFEKYSEELFGFIIDGMVKVHVHEIYPLQEVARAHTDLEGRKTTGKLLLKP
jgi:NADPH:quinone reductase